MLTLILVLALQTARPVAPEAAGVLKETRLFQGKVIDDLKQPARVHLILKDDRNNQVLARTDSFANGTFYFEGPFVVNDKRYVPSGEYVISVTDPRYLFRDVPLIGTGHMHITIDLVRSGGAPAVPSNRTAYLDDLDRLNMDEIAKSTTPAAFAEFQIGVDLARLGAHREDLLVSASGNPADVTPEMHFKKAISIAPDFYEGTFQLGVEQLRTSHTSDALGTLEHAAAMNPSDARPLRVLSDLYLQQKEYQKTVDSLLKVSTLGSLNAADRTHLGMAFENLSNPAAAQQQFATAISQAPGTNPQAYLHLHNMYIKMNQLPEGIAVLEDFVRLFPNDPNRKMAEDRIKKLRADLKKSKP